jgi:hypothetical protein
MNKMISSIIENSVRYSIKNKLFHKIVLLVEMYMILIEILMGMYKLSGRYVVNFEQALFSGDLYKDDYIYILTMLSPYMWIRSLNKCSIVNSINYCYFPKIAFFVIVILGIIIAISVILLNYKYDDDKIVRKTNSFINMLKPMLYNTYEILFLKVLGMSLFYITINTFLSSWYLVDNEHKMSVFSIIFSGIFLICYFMMYIVYVKYFNIIVRLNYDYPNDNYFSRNYDFYLVILKVLIAVENNFIAFNGRINYLERVLNVIIIILSFGFIIKVMFNLIKRKIIYFMNNRLNSYRINLVIFVNLITIYFVIFELTKSRFKNGTFLFIFVLLIPLSRYITNWLCQRSYSLIYIEKHVILVFLYLMNHKNNLYISNEFENKGNEKKKKLNDTVFNLQVNTLYIQHRNQCKSLDCEICRLEEVSFSSLIFGMFKQCEVCVANNQLSNLDLKYFEYVKLLYHFHYENDKRIKLYFETVRSMERNRNDLVLYNNISLLKSVICLDRKEQTSTFSLINQYEKINNLTDKVIDTLKDLVLCSTNGEINLNYLIEDINSVEKSLEQKLMFVSKHKDIYVDDYNLVIGRFIYSSLFNKEIRDNLANYTIDIYEERLESLFSSNYLLMKYQDKTHSLIIVSGTKEFASYKGKQLREILVGNFGFETHIKRNIKENKGYQFNSNFLIKADKNYIKYVNSRNSIIQSVKHSDLYIISEFDIKETELLLVKDNQPSTESFINVLQLFNKIHLSQVIYSFSEDLRRSLYLLPEWITYLQSYHSNVNLSKVFTHSCMKSSKKQSDYLDINYATYYKTYEKILQKIMFELGADFFKTEQYDTMYKEIADLADIKKTYTFKLGLINSFKDDKEEVYNLYRIKHIKQFKFNRITNEDESIATDSEKFEVRNTVSSITSNSQYSDLNIQKTMKNNIENNTIILRKYSRLTFLFNIIIFIYCCTCLYVGIQNNNRYMELIDIRNTYLKTKNNIYHSMMSIMHCTKLYSAQSYKMETIDKYLISELPIKVARMRDALNELKVVLYSYAYNTEIQLTLDKQLNYNHVYVKGDKLLISKQNLKFLDVIYIYISNTNALIGYLNDDFIYLNIFKDYDKEINIQYLDGESIDPEQLPEYTFMLYEMIMNYHLVYNSFNYLESLLDIEQSLNSTTQLYVTMGLTVALLGLHFILIFICKKIIDFLNNVIETNNKLLIDVFSTHIVKAMVSKLNTMKLLNHYYKDNPVKSLNYLRQIKKEFNEISRKEKIKEIKSQEAGKTRIKTDMGMNMINKFAYLTPLKRILYFTFIIYFVYSITIYLFLLQSFNSIYSTTNYIFVNTKVFNSIYNNAIVSRILVYQNKTDLELANLMEATGTYQDKGYLATSIDNLLNMNELLIIRKEQSNIINYYYKLYAQDMLNCQTRLDLFNDPIINSAVGNNTNVIEIMTDLCNSFPVMKTDINQFFSEYNYRCIHILRAISANKEMDDIIQINEGDIKSLYYMILILFRPLQTFILFKINIEGIGVANGDYLVFTFIFFSLNILVDMILCFIVNKYVVNRSRSINNNLTTIINCLKV